jgi:hypothetical protein
MSFILSAGSYNGVSWGHPGDALRVQSQSGFGDLPSIREHTTPRSAADGNWRARRFTDALTLQLGLAIVPVSGYTVDASCRLLEAATGVQRSISLPLLFDAGSKRANVFVAQRLIDRQRDNLAKATLAFETVEPAVYANTETVIASVFGGIVSATNSGNAWAYPVITAVGPVTGPCSFSDAHGNVVTVNTSLGGGDTLVVDFFALSCRLNGILVSETSASDWWILQPGAQNISAFCGSGTGTVTYRFRSTWA